MEAFSNLLADRLVYEERERDMVAMHHEFGVELADGTRETRTSSLLAYGDPDGDTSMAKLWTVLHKVDICIYIYI